MAQNNQEKDGRDEDLRAENMNLRNVVTRLSTAMGQLENRLDELQRQVRLQSTVLATVLPNIRFSELRKHPSIAVLGAVMTKRHGAPVGHFSAILDEAPVLQGRFLRVFRPNIVANNYFMIEVLWSPTEKHDVYAGAGGKPMGLSFYGANANIYRDGANKAYDGTIGAVGSPTLIGVEVHATAKKVRFIRNGLKGCWLPLPDTTTGYYIGCTLYTALDTIEIVPSHCGNNIPANEE